MTLLSDEIWKYNKYSKLFLDIGIFINLHNKSKLLIYYKTGSTTTLKNLVIYLKIIPTFDEEYFGFTFIVNTNIYRVFLLPICIY